MSSLRYHPGKEMIRIEGCHMFMMNSCGKVGAFEGYQTLGIVVPEWLSTQGPKCAYLKVCQWLYPLDRSYSSIYCWRDRMIILEPFSHILHPRYIVIRLPYPLTEDQASTLWNLLDMNAQVLGKFCYTSENMVNEFQSIKLDPIDECELHNAPSNANASDLKVLKPQNKGKKRKKKKKKKEEKEKTARDICEIAESPPQPDNEGKQIYVTGPRDERYIKVITTPAPVSISYQVFLAVHIVYKELVKKRSKKEEEGIPSPFGFRKAMDLKACKLAELSKLPQLHQPGNLASAAAHFDGRLNKTRFIMVRPDLDEERAKRLNPCKIKGPLTSQPITPSRGCCLPLFDTLMILTPYNYPDHAYPSIANFERVLEDCEHHYPKERPANPNPDPTV